MEKTVVTFTNQPKASITSSTSFRHVLDSHNSNQSRSGVRNHFPALYCQRHGLGIFNNIVFADGYFSIYLGLANQHTIHLLLKSKNLSRHSTFNSIAYYLYPSKVCTFLLSFVNMFANVGFGKFLIIVSRCYDEHSQRSAEKIAYLAHWLLI